MRARKRMIVTTWRLAEIFHLTIPVSAVLKGFKGQEKNAQVNKTAW